jgi:hypothetical protein
VIKRRKVPSLVTWVGTSLVFSLYDVVTILILHLKFNYSITLEGLDGFVNSLSLYQDYGYQFNAFPVFIFRRYLCLLLLNHITLSKGICSRWEICVEVQKQL